MLVVRSMILIVSSEFARHTVIPPTLFSIGNSTPPNVLVTPNGIGSLDSYLAEKMPNGHRNFGDSSQKRLM